MCPGVRSIQDVAHDSTDLIVIWLEIRRLEIRRLQRRPTRLLLNNWQAPARSKVLAHTRVPEQVGMYRAGPPEGLSREGRIASTATSVRLDAAFTTSQSPAWPRPGPAYGQE